MKPSLEHDDVGPAGRLFGKFDRRLDDFGARICEEERVDARRRQFGKSLRKGLEKVVGVDIGLRVDEPFSLTGDRCDNSRVAVARRSDSDAPCEVQVAFSADGRDPGAQAGRDVEIGDLEPYV